MQVEPMIKTGRVAVGETPSAVSGKPSTKVEKGEALAKEEKAPKDLLKLTKNFAKKD